MAVICGSVSMNLPGPGNCTVTDSEASETVEFLDLGEWGPMLETAEHACVTYEDGLPPVITNVVPY